MSSGLTIRTICKICQGYPEYTGVTKDNLFEHKCKTCGDITLKDKKYPYDKSITKTTYVKYPGEV